MLTVGSLFSGIGGMDLGLERAGMQVVWQSEIDPYACEVLKKHWPNIPNLGDITKIEKAPPVDLICGGFPCQDISNAGNHAGIDGDRSSLWFEMSRIVRLVEPQYILVENVAALLVRGFDDVLGDLAESGYDCEWDCIPAGAIGAPHIRDRVFIVARDTGNSGSRRFQRKEECPNGKLPVSETFCSEMAHAQVFTQRAGLCESDATRNGQRRSGDISGSRHTWATEPDVGRVAHGVPARVDRLRGLGNAVVPQVAEYIGRQILEQVA